MKPLPTLQREISARMFMDEQEAVRALLAAAEPLKALEDAVMARATKLAEIARENQPMLGVESFLAEYGLDTAEGVAIMCLAEALLRIPDADTADRLIYDKFNAREWDKHLGASDSVFINASSWGLMLTGKIVSLSGEGARNVISKLIGKMGEPVIREALKKAMRFIGGQFVLGENIADALSKARSGGKKGWRYSFDILGEGARNDAQAQGYIRAYEHAIKLVGEDARGMDLFDAPSISVKLSALHPRYSMSKEKRVMEELQPRLLNLLKRAKDANITVSIDAEEAARLDIEMELFAAVARAPELAGWNGLGFVLQAYGKRAFYVIDWLKALAVESKRVFPLRLVKGAYWDTEIKLSQVGGYPGYPVFTRKEHTDLSYVACAGKMLEGSAHFYPQFATHNARTVAQIIEMADARGLDARAYEFQRLHGMGEALHEEVLKTHKSRIYAPVGEHEDLLAYLIRRLLENGANSSFVHLLMNEDVPLSKLLEDPAEKTRAGGGTQAANIPAPKAIYGAHRDNSSGIELGQIFTQEALMQSLKKLAGIAGGIAVTPTPPDAVESMICNASVAQMEWGALPVAERARILRKAAEALEEERDELIALCCEEAGKTIPDGIAEVREAADFLRYYATEAERLMQPHALTGPTGESNVLSVHPRGMFVCISPWNFPLAIFMGQVVAALATGNSVIAKPAEQTPRIAIRAVEILHEAGVPKGALQLAIGKGSVVGAALVSHERTSGVVFTGSTDTAQRIAKSLAERKGAIVPLIAETGGQNCMVVDSSALLEQACDDIVLSAFGSAGQRCSALRVLFVQDDVADKLLALLSGALAELQLGDPAQVETDIGPVIDAGAKQGLMAHIARMEKEAKLVAKAKLPEMAGNFVAPHIFEIRGIEQLTGEVFGPILHVVRFKAGEHEKVVRAINSTGFGLTFGIHSRIEEHVQYFCTRVHAGNFYVNRSITGAVVGVQPFGGEGLSGTGPKAGGPHYLLRFVTERTTTVNTAAIGGNIGLLAG